MPDGLLSLIAPGLFSNLAVPQRRDADDAHKLWVQLGEDRLNYWIHDSTFTEGKHETVEMQMDYARGAQRRSAAGFGKFDK